MQDAIIVGAGGGDVKLMYARKPIRQMKARGRLGDTMITPILGEPISLTCALFPFWPGCISTLAQQTESAAYNVVSGGQLSPAQLAALADDCATGRVQASGGVLTLDQARVQCAQDVNLGNKTSNPAAPDWAQWALLGGIGIAALAIVLSK